MNVKRPTSARRAYGIKPVRPRSFSGSAKMVVRNKPVQTKRIRDMVSRKLWQKMKESARLRSDEIKGIGIALFVIYFYIIVSLFN